MQIRQFPQQCHDFIGMGIQAFRESLDRQKTNRTQVLPCMEESLLGNENFCAIRNQKSQFWRLGNPNLERALGIESLEIVSLSKNGTKVVPHFCEPQILRLRPEPLLCGLNVLMFQLEDAFPVKVYEDLNRKLVQILFHQRFHLV